MWTEDTFIWIVLWQMPEGTRFMFHRSSISFEINFIDCFHKKGEEETKKENPLIYIQYILRE